MELPGEINPATLSQKERGYCERGSIQMKKCFVLCLRLILFTVDNLSAFDVQSLQRCLLGGV
jgi:hypothetical protein